MQLELTTVTGAAIASALLACAAQADDLAVLSVTPKNAAVHAVIAAPISVHFDRPVNPKTISTSTFWAFAKSSGAVSGTYVFSDKDQTVSLLPDHPFFYGETVIVLLSHDIVAADGSPLRGAGYAWRFTTHVRPSALSLAVVATLTTDISHETTVPYGGNPSDVTEDGWPDLVISNEGTNEVRVFPNAADGTVMVGAIVRPPAAVGDTPSPSDLADFDRDGHTDVVVGNYGDGTASIILGNGDGTFGPPQSIDCSNSTVGVTALDLDGDGDLDIAAANPLADNVSISFNDGTGTFGATTDFDAGGTEEWPVTSADMNNDGIFDLIVGAKGDAKVIVRLGQGNGTFGEPLTQNAGGSVWMLSIGDVNGDGIEDVAAANGGSATTAILLGTGTGSLNPPTTYNVDPAVVATDLADLDGDGDLDWVISSFAGDWRFMRNNGKGGYTFIMEIDAPNAASCALPSDLDKDGDLDVGLVDELADLLKLVRNSGYTPLGDLNFDGAVNAADLGLLLGAWGQTGDLLLADLNGDGIVDASDLALLLGGWSV